MTRIVLTAVTILVYSALTLTSSTLATVGTGRLAALQLESSDSSYVAATFGTAVLSGIGGWLSLALLTALCLIWFSPVRRLVSALICAVACVLIVASSAHAFYDTTDRTEVYYVLPNQSAFWIPDVGNNLATQTQFGSVAYYDANKIPAKRFVVPHAKLSGSGGTAILSGYDYYVPTGRLYIVDRTPFFREFVDDEARGTSATKQGFHFETLDSVNVGTGVTVAASVPEDQASRFLYYFGTKTTGDVTKPEYQFQSVIWGKSLADVMDTIVRGKIQEQLAAEFGKRTFSEAIAQKPAIMAAVAKAVRDEFGPKGIVLDFIGYSGGLDFDPAIQASIDRTVVAGNDVVAISKVQASLPLLQQKAAIDAVNTTAGRWDGHLPPLLPTGLVDALSGLFSGKH